MIVLWIKAHRKLVTLVLVALVLGTLASRYFLSAFHHDPLTAPLQRGKIIEGVYGIGTVMTNRSYDIKPAINNILNEVYVKEGDEVQRDQKLLRMENITYKAPFAGIVTYLPFKTGEIVFVQSIVLSLTDFSDRYLVVSLEQEGALRVRPGQKAKLNFDSMREQTFEGTVEAVYSHQQNFLARIGIAHLPVQILPGMTADVAIGIREHDNALLIPMAALEGQSVYVRSRFKNRPVPVKIGITDGLMAEVLSGNIKEGDRLILRQKPEN